MIEDFNNLLIALGEHISHKCQYGERISVLSDVLKNKDYFT